MTNNNNKKGVAIKGKASKKKNNHNNNNSNEPVEEPIISTTMDEDTASTTDLGSTNTNTSHTTTEKIQKQSSSSSSKKQQQQSSSQHQQHEEELLTVIADTESVLESYGSEDEDMDHSEAIHHHHHHNHNHNNNNNQDTKNHSDDNDDDDDEKQKLCHQLSTIIQQLDVNVMAQFESSTLMQQCSPYLTNTTTNNNNNNNTTNNNNNNNNNNNTNNEIQSLVQEIRSIASKQQQVLSSLSQQPIETSEQWEVFCRHNHHNHHNNQNNGCLNDQMIVQLEKQWRTNKTKSFVRELSDALRNQRNETKVSEMLSHYSIRYHSDFINVTLSSNSNNNSNDSDGDGDNSKVLCDELNRLLSESRKFLQEERLRRERITMTISTPTSPISPTSPTTNASIIMVDQASPITPITPITPTIDQFNGEDLHSVDINDESERKRQQELVRAQIEQVSLILESTSRFSELETSANTRETTDSDSMDTKDGEDYFSIERNLKAVAMRIEEERLRQQEGTKTNSLRPHSGSVRRSRLDAYFADSLRTPPPSEASHTETSQTEDNATDIPVDRESYSDSDDDGDEDAFLIKNSGARGTTSRHSSNADVPLWKKLFCCANVRDHYV